MQYLIDTHVCFWAIVDNDKLSVKAKGILENTDNKVFVSSISFLELTINIQTGKLVEIKNPLSEFIKSVSSSGFEILPFETEHAIAYSTFTYFDEHRDPFDRLLIATAHFENMAFITKDKMFQLYKDKVKILW